MKILAAVLVIVVVLHVFLATRDEPDGGWLELLLQKKAAGLAPRVRMEDVQSDALSGNFLQLGAAPVTVVSIAGREGSRVRKLTVTPASSGSFRVRFEPAGGESDVPPIPDQETTASKPLEVTVGERGGTLTIARIGPATPARIDLK